MRNHKNHLVPEAGKAMDRLKNETANELGVELKDYNPDMKARDAGKIGGNMVRKMIESYEREHARD